MASGIFQGSVLDSILFIIYANDLDSNILGKIAKFADNTKLGHTAWNEIGRDISIIQRDEGIIYLYNKSFVTILGGQAFGAVVESIILVF